MANKPHTIKLEELETLVVRQQIAASYGKGDNKELIFEYDVKTDITTWHVFSRGKLQRFGDLSNAIRAYNEAR